MQNEQVIPAPNQEDKETGKKVLIIVGVVLLLLTIGGISYIIGKQNTQTQENQTQQITPILTQFSTPSPTNIPTPTATVSATVSPTGTPSPTPEEESETLSSEASLDGFRASNGGGNSTLDIRAGRNIYLVQRGFLSFDLSTIPADATITKATLRIYQYKVVGNPYSVGGNLKIDHLDYGDSLGNEDYSTSAILASFTTVTNNPTVEWKDIDVTERVKNDLENERERSQYRIHFETETTGGDASGDFTYFEAEDNSGETGNTPQLMVAYY